MMIAERLVVGICLNFERSVAQDIQVSRVLRPITENPSSLLRILSVTMIKSVCRSVEKSVEYTDTLRWRRARG